MPENGDDQFVKLNNLMMELLGNNVPALSAADSFLENFARVIEYARQNKIHPYNYLEGVYSPTLEEIDRNRGTQQPVNKYQILKAQIEAFTEGRDSKPTGEKYKVFTSDFRKFLTNILRFAALNELIPVDEQERITSNGRSARTDSEGMPVLNDLINNELRDCDAFTPRSTLTANIANIREALSERGLGLSDLTSHSPWKYYLDLQLKGLSFGRTQTKAVDGDPSHPFIVNKVELLAFVRFLKKERIFELDPSLPGCIAVHERKTDEKLLLNQDYFRLSHKLNTDTKDLFYPRLSRALRLIDPDCVDTSQVLECGNDIRKAAWQNDLTGNEDRNDKLVAAIAVLYRDYPSIHHDEFDTMIMKFRPSINPGWKKTHREGGVTHFNDLLTKNNLTLEEVREKAKSNNSQNPVLCFLIDCSADDIANFGIYHKYEIFTCKPVCEAMLQAVSELVKEKATRESPSTAVAEPASESTAIIKGAEK